MNSRPQLPHSKRSGSRESSIRGEGVSRCLRLQSNHPADDDCGDCKVRRGRATHCQWSLGYPLFQWRRWQLWAR